MLTLSGYCLSTQIYESFRTLVYRGQRVWDSQPVVIKLMRSEYPSFNQLVQFRNQYTITKNLNLSGIIHPYSLENYRNGFALIMEDFGGISLKDYITNDPLSLSDFFFITLQIATTLEKIHRERVIHKDIKPANLLINPSTKQVKITDFGIASLLPKENQVLTNPNVLEGTLVYLSPEQTGRMNRGIDYRSDFYSLGITFYELLTGQLPFTSTDPMELVYCHIAKQPPAIHEINSAIPPVLSVIVSKLMAKNAEDRYQSALGLKYDLERCLHQWETSRRITSFELGKRDIAERFIIPEKLYGRETEVATLLAAFNRVSQKEPEEENSSHSLFPISHSRSEMILVAGYSGIGKTAVVNEVHKPIVRQRGYFIRGKFDQFQRNIPFSALVQAFRDLMAQLLAESTQQLEQWQAEMLSALGENGQVIIDVIPEVELLIGKQPPIVDLSPSAAQNRFNLVFQKFIRVFTSAAHPLVIFLDDLQWADSASLKLIQVLMSDIDNLYLLLIGAYRDNEVSPAHPLMLTLEEIRKTQATVNTITLAPLSQTDLNKLIAETLSCSPELALPLTQLVYAKTKGNPFFSNQFLKALYEDELITFNFEGRHWQCDIARVKTLSLTDDVVEFMALQLQKLPEMTQEVMKLAACIGNQFDLDELSIVYEKSQAETAAALWKALQEGFIIPKSEIYKFFQDSVAVDLVTDITDRFCYRVGAGKEIDKLSATSDTKSVAKSTATVPYKFLHDRVQQAAYFLIPTEQKPFTHLKIGQLMLMNTSLEEREEKLFDILNQLNVGADLITDNLQRQELAQLNLLAGHKAKLSTAYEPAVRYLTVGLSLLAENSWQGDYQLTLDLYIAAAEAEYLNINFERSARLADIALQNATSLLDRVKVYELQMQISIAQLEMLKAVELGLYVLEGLSVSLLTIDGEENLVVELPSMADLEYIPAMTDPYKLSGMEILKFLCTPVFQAKPEIFPQLILTMIKLCLDYGNSAASAFAYGFYGLLLVGIGKLEAGYQAGIIALKLLEQFEAKELKAKVYNLFNSNIRTWKEHAKLSVVPLQVGVQSGLETGDIEWGGYCAANLCSYLFFTEENLAAAIEQQALYIDLCIKIKQEIPTYFSQVWRQLGLNLQGRAADVQLLIGESFDESQMLPRLIETKTGTVLFIFYVAKTILLYQFQDYEGARQNVALAKEQAGAAFGFMQVAILNFYHSLALLGCCVSNNISDRQNYLEQVEANQAMMKQWAYHAPMNYQHKYELVAAENARVLGQNWEAADLYDRAISLARENEYIAEEAIANELAARFYLGWGKEKIARSYMIDAYYNYARWGAKAKVEDLEKRYPQLLAPILQSEKISRNSREELEISTKGETLISNNTTVSEELDLVSAIKASQTLSEEIERDKLLSTLIKIVMENAGASKCALILNEGDNLGVAAIATISPASPESTTLLMPSIPVEESLAIPLTPLNYVKHSLHTLVIDNATDQAFLASDPYIIEHQPKSLLCTPLLNQSKLMGILYLENNLATGAFTRDRLEILKVLCSQAAISLENARLYQESQNYAHQLEEFSQKLQQAQLQIIQSEKMASLGQLVAGVAHEINNPVGFIAGNLDQAIVCTQEIIDHLTLYRQYYPNPVPAIGEHAEDIDLEFLLEDLPKILSSMRQGTERIRHISNSMRTFSRADSDRLVPFNIHEGIDSTLLILKHRLKANDARPAIKIVKQYGELPDINCYPGQLNQVFMNILANAIDALEEANQGKSYADIQSHPNQITISTQMAADPDRVTIRIADNGIGMSEAVRQHIFDHHHLLTTKPVGKGTGLGLSIARQIIEEQHNGQLICISSPGQGTEFAIAIPSEASGRKQEV
ncbi:MAG TPA: serine/threonine protein kinase [Cyanobacteria bacterium UBA8803]|nr:serine/threonine protein kinase [Cyanobacteria bacterium UBA9273]HBL59084.1 serine/threonine protein kinase [Cyanobacteria bacterium UBA8803]